MQASRTKSGSPYASLAHDGTYVETCLPAPCPRPASRPSPSTGTPPRSRSPGHGSALLYQTCLVHLGPRGRKIRKPISIGRAVCGCACVRASAKIRRKLDNGHKHHQHSNNSQQQPRTIWRSPLEEGQQQQRQQTTPSSGYSLLPNMCGYIQ